MEILLYHFPADAGKIVPASARMISHPRIRPLSGMGGNCPG
jgi:hypothetical protein